MSSDKYGHFVNLFFNATISSCVRLTLPSAFKLTLSPSWRFVNTIGVIREGTLSSLFQCPTSSSFWPGSTGHLQKQMQWILTLLSGWPYRFQSGSEFLCRRQTADRSHALSGTRSALSLLQVTQLCLLQEESRIRRHHFPENTDRNICNRMKLTSKRWNEYFITNIILKRLDHDFFDLLLYLGSVWCFSGRGVRPDIMSCICDFKLSDLGPKNRLDCYCRLPARGCAEFFQSLLSTFFWSLTVTRSLVIQASRCLMFFLVTHRL